MSEADLLRAVRATFDRLGVCYLRLNAGLTVVGHGASRRVIRGVEAGAPDIEVLLPGGRVVWIELKTSAGKLTPSQRKWHARAAKLGHRVAVCRTVQQAVDACAAMGST